MLCFLDVLASKQVTVKFVQDTSKFWYKPDISRDQGVYARHQKESKHWFYTKELH